MPFDFHPDLQALPVWRRRDAIVEALGSGGRLVLSAPTGSGKSTVVPCILDGVCDAGEIWVLEPRRLAARMLARRVATLTRSELGQQVGYQTRYETRAGRDTRIRFLTAGILPRAMVGNPELRGVAAVVFDEFHERSLDTDVGLGLVRRLADSARPDLRLVAMSATLEAKRLAEFLRAQTVETHGRLHPVEIEYRPPRRQEPMWDAAAKAVSELVRTQSEGDVLVFMPGAFEIARTVRALEPVRRRGGLEVLPLHGSMSAEAQNRVMDPGDRRRVIVATNIAETSLTIPGVRHVVDSGLVRMSHYDAGRGVDMLLREPISAHSAEQRSGRAGRTAPGTCLRLWELQTQYAKPTETEPEVRRSDLAPVLLQLHGLGVANPATFPWFDSPEPAALEQAESVLHDLRALDEHGRLTEQGSRLLAIPAHPRIARFLLEAQRRECAELATLAAAVLSERAFMPSDRKAWQVLEDRFGRRDGPPSDLLVATGVLQALDRGTVNPDDLKQLDVHVGGAKEAVRAARHLRRTLRRAAGAGQAQTLEAAGEDLIRCMALAFPDHLARRRDRATLLCELRNGRSAELARHSTARDGALLVAGEIHQTGGGGASEKTVLNMVSVVPDPWLPDLFGNAFEETIETVWDPRRCEARTELRSVCLGLVLEREDVPGGDPEAESALLADYVWRNRESLRHWDDDLRRWLDRVRWLAATFPERELPAYDDEQMRRAIEQFCADERRFAAVRNKPLLPFVQNQLTWHQQEWVRNAAPERIKLPCGRRMRIDYDPSRRPRGKARIQDLFGLTKTPVIADGRERLLIEIQAPNHRAVQITDDLEGFWRDLYPKVKQELRRRYPKHEWR